VANDALKSDYGVLLGLTGPILLQRAKEFREIAMLLGPGAAATYMKSQADRAEQSIIALGAKFNEQYER